VPVIVIGTLIVDWPFHTAEPEKVMLGFKYSTRILPSEPPDKPRQ
jgi:hypothetical protein